MLRNAHILIYYLIISYKSIEFYRVETIHMRIFYLNDGVDVKFNLVQYYSTYCTRQDILVGVIPC